MTIHSTLKPIQTRAYGRLFRSRLEARYAIFLTKLGVLWQYEPEGFQLDAGFYLPDFYLPEVNGGTWLEIKPHGSGSYFGWASSNRISDPRLDEFAEKTQPRQFFVAYGIPECLFDYHSPGLLEAPYDPHFWCVCQCGSTVGIEFDGRGDRINCRHCKSAHGDKGYSYNHPLILDAARAALSARFEHGEAW